METFFAFVAPAFGIVLGVAPVLQMKILWQTKNADSVSLGYWVILAIAMVNWLSYGILTSNTPIIVANVPAVTTAVAMILLVLHLRKNHGYKPEPAISVEPALTN